MACKFGGEDHTIPIRGVYLNLHKYATPNTVVKYPPPPPSSKDRKAKEISYPVVRDLTRVSNQNLQLEFVSNPLFSKKVFGGSNIAIPLWREQLELFKINFKILLIF